MKFIKTALDGAYKIELEPLEDYRGNFSRSFDYKEFKSRGLDFNIVQCNISYNRHVGTLRGMHYQAEPFGEGKLIRCTRGLIYDVIIDLRLDSPTFGKWDAFELSAESGNQIFIPKGFAHGFQTLEDDTEVFYLMSEYYQKEFARGIRWDDPAFGIHWPINDKVLSERDKSFASFSL